MNFTVIEIVSVVHIFLCLFYFFLIKIHAAHFPEAVMPVMVFIPVFGPLSVMMLEWIVCRKKEGINNIDVNKMQPASSIYNKIRITTDENPGEIVPLEEAVLINDVNIRRSIMMEILHKDPIEFLDLLRDARFASDIELSHYATTTVMEIQREYELGIQKAAVSLEQNPDDLLVLDKYIDILGKYIDSGLLQDYLLFQQRMLYSKLLEKSVKIEPRRKHIYFKIIDNDMGTQNYIHALKTADFMREKWPSDENVWIAALRVYVDSGNTAGKNALLAEIRKETIEWTSGGKDLLKFWYGEDFRETKVDWDKQKLVGA